ncbi:hypothetical protein EZS27_033840 [termite gut metagenome]|uniref:Uncharacterized protein n=1 Tax=termite gut metagenome TaxID=433724 RepID=A0A5J4Q262_9ZZZZ
MSENLAITPEQLDLLQHAIGYTSEKVENGIFVFGRNWCAYKEENASWEELVKKGYASKRALRNLFDEAVYHVSKKGVKLLETSLLISIIPRSDMEETLK